MGNETAASSGQRPDAETQAGQALRRLRLGRGWSQEEVAARMTAYGYDFHQTTIAKIEAAQRPLRVGELADFAALYGVEIQDLVHPPTGSLAETDVELREVNARLDAVRAEASEIERQLDEVRATELQLQASQRVSDTEAALLHGRLAALEATRQKLAGWESAGAPSHAEPGHRAGQAMPDSGEPAVAPAAGDPTILGTLLGMQLRRLREYANVTPDEAAYAIRASKSKISRIESGRERLREVDVADLLSLYGVTDKDDRVAILELVYKTGSPGWWNRYSDILPSWFEAYVSLAEVADPIKIYETRHIPDPLQTTEYARALNSHRNGGKSAEDTDRALRPLQAVLERPDPPSVQIVLDEAVLHRTIGSPAVMRDQLLHLARFARQRNVTVQIIPFRPAGLTRSDSFTILRLGRQMPDVIYIEQLTSALYVDDHEDVRAYQRLMERLTADALNPGATEPFLHHVLSET